MNIRTALYLSHRLRGDRLGQLNPRRELELATDVLAQLSLPAANKPHLSIVENGDGSFYIKGPTVKMARVLVHLLAAVAAQDHRSTNNIVKEFEEALQMVLAGRSFQGEKNAKR